MIYILCHKTDYLEYILEGINISEVSILNMNDECNFFQKFLRKTWPLETSIPLFFFGRRMRLLLKNLNDHDSILVIDYRNRNLISSLSKLMPRNVKKYLWFWNPLKDETEHSIVRQLDIFKKQGFEICTFNINDAEKYNIKYLNQFYRMFPETVSEPEVKFDFYFLGYQKDRSDDIDYIGKRLLKYRTSINIVKNERERISYKKNLELIKSSHCIIDLVQKDQLGISLRPLEALAFNKKLLTNNEKIIDYEFYNPKNIFIIGRDRLEELESFIFSEFIIVSDCIKRKYDVNQWILYFEN